ncbi:MAG TPA: M48 family metalloprotease [Rhodocyclaceae bacterium]|nr:M48 family metalloprotease [Rhodocyclaceae bacterium]
MRRPLPHRFAAFLLALLLAPPLGLAEGLPDLGEAAQADLPPALEQRIGQAILNEYRSEPEFVDDAEVVGYLNRLGHRLAEKSNDVRQPFEFFVIRDKTLNAFAMPGGYIGVHTALILAAQTESELAGVLAHEISHVTQRHLARMFNKQNQSTVPTLIAMAVAVLAARNNSSVGMGGVMAAQAAGIQSQLNYTRDFEREADRVGFDLLDRSGFDVHGMESFFERLQKFGRLYENNAPGYLRTHPLTTERIADMANRAQGKPYRQVREPIEFLLVRAKLKAFEGSPRDAVADFGAQLKEKKYANEAASHFGMAYAQMRAGNLPAVTQELAELRRLKVQSSMVDLLSALLAQKLGDFNGAENQLRMALFHNPQERALSYALADVLLSARKPDVALKHIFNDMQLWPGDAQLYLLQAQCYAAQGKLLLQHRSQADAYAMRGQLPQAIEQLQLAQKSPDGDFFEYSQVEALLRELKQKRADEAKEKLP